jgi:hypothetical protein
MNITGCFEDFFCERLGCSSRALSHPVCSELSLIREHMGWLAEKIFNCKKPLLYLGFPRLLAEELE